MTEIIFRLLDDSLSAVHVDDVMHELREDLLALDVDSAQRGTGPAPEGTRGAELVETAFLVVQAAVETGLARMLAERVRDWLTRNRVSKLEISIGDASLILTNATNEQQQQLVKHFMSATSTKSGK